MPEGPEVSVICQGLNNLLKGKYIHDLDYNFPTSRYFKRKPVGYNEFITTLPVKVTRVSSKGKFLYFEFDNDWYMYNTLGMSGGWYHKIKKHPHLVIGYGDKKVSGDNIQKIWFEDQRHFGTFKFVHGKSELDKKLKGIGADLLNDVIPGNQFIQKYRKNNHKKIDTVLHDQKIFSGIGNYLKAEILYEAQISPHTLIQNIPDWKLLELLKIAKKKIKASFDMGGASVEHYSDLEGTEGTYYKCFQVYGKKIDPKGNPVISERVSKPKDPKSQKTYWVPNVQKDTFPDK